MKKYAKPSVEIEKFSVADVITESSTGDTIDRDIIDSLSTDLEVGDEF